MIFEVLAKHGKRLEGKVLLAAVCFTSAHHTACIQMAVAVTPLPACRADAWEHVYHPKRLTVVKPCAAATGTIVDASKGRHRDGARHEADGDGHFFLRLDPGQEQFLNAKNLSNEDGNLVFEPVCLYRVTQKDALAACKNYKQNIVVPPVGTHVKIVGAFVLDTQHGHNEIHPVTSIEVIP